ncbi:MAG: hypothetical protein CME88_16935 [Hirschia sp.]|nr:hypothetical protein [Hirschia sp.]MBF20062.1 hypothetical protein [Hirschia sp.]|tara:strand:+ start:175 stop:387 length:213 start_codon:yes stop_codon:yes gene_type:complete
MGRDWQRYELACPHCGQNGKLSLWNDDWFRLKVVEITGFKGRIIFGFPKFDTFKCENCGVENPAVKDLGS